MKIIKYLTFILIFSTYAIALSGCFNNNGAGSSTAVQSGSTTNSGTSSGTTNSGTSGTTTSSGTSSVGPHFLIVSGTIDTSTAASSGTANTDPSITLYFNASNPSTVLTTYCQKQAASGSTSGSGSDTTRACSCNYTWAETNSATSASITRTVQTAPTAISSFQLACPLPSVYTNEIPNGTIIQITVVPNATNTSGFTTNTFNLTKNPITNINIGDFLDSQGRPYRNIVHYSCYDKYAKNTTITHAQGTPITGSNSQFPIANQFNTGASSPNSFSAQSYYYDFYVQSNTVGQINESNTNFTCPQVQKSNSTSPNFYPLDSTFALAISSSNDFPVPLTANMTLNLAANSNPTTNGVIGYAAKPNSSGICPSFIDSGGTVRRTFRLRQYLVLYPLRYNADGTIADKSQPANSVLILDRPVNKTGQDPLTPLTRLGPKPCPFALKVNQSLSANGITNTYLYACTYETHFGEILANAIFNVDGTRIQNNVTCPIYPPIPFRLYPKYVEPTSGDFVIRPFKSFVPHYMENTSFQACAFQSATPVDPEIVVTGSSPAYYCTKNYPYFQEPLESDAKRPAARFPSETLVPPPNGDPFDKPPAACRTQSAQNAIQLDDSYKCSFTYNPSAATGQTPTAGCCQSCSGSCGGIAAINRNAINDASVGGAFNAIRQLGAPNGSSPSTPHTCFDPYEN